MTLKNYHVLLAAYGTSFALAAVTDLLPPDNFFTAFVGLSSILLFMATLFFTAVLISEQELTDNFN